MTVGRVRRAATAALPIRAHSTSSYNHFVGQRSSDGAAAADAPTGTTTTPFRLAVKDNIATAGFPTQCGSHILSGHQSPYEATIVRQLRDRGATVVGKTNMDEFGMGSHSTHSAHGPVVNPLLGLGLSAGGSSGGSAVAVAAGDADVALGTDTGGSIRLPAAYTGCVGYKPSYGMLSRHGVVPYANSLDTVGLLAAGASTIRDLVFGTGLDMAHDPLDPTSLTPASRRRCSPAGDRRLPPLSDLTIGIPLEYNISELEAPVREAWARTAAALSSLGAAVVPVSLPTTREALCAYYVLAPAEASSNLAKYDGVRYGSRSEDEGASAPGAAATLYSGTRGAGFGDEVRRRILLGTYTLSSEAMDNHFLQAQRVRRLVQRDFDRVFRLDNPLRGSGGGSGEEASSAPQQFDLCDMPDSPATRLVDRRGPAQVDFLLCPTAPTLPPSLDDVLRREGADVVDAYTSDVFTVPASLAGLPAVSVPVGTDRQGVPAGMQLIGQYWDDARLLVLAERLETLAAE